MNKPIVYVAKDNKLKSTLHVSNGKIILFNSQTQHSLFANNVFRYFKNQF